MQQQQARGKTLVLNLVTITTLHGRTVSVELTVYTCTDWETNGMHNIVDTWASNAGLCNETVPGSGTLAVCVIDSTSSC